MENYSLSWQRRCGQNNHCGCLLCAVQRCGFRTLVVSTDIAHSLADSLDTVLESQPKWLPQSFAQEINVVEEIRRIGAKCRIMLAMSLRKQGMSKAVADEMAIILGMEEIVSLLHINKQAQEGNSTVIVDAVPPAKPSVCSRCRKVFNGMPGG